MNAGLSRVGAGLLGVLTLAAPMIARAQGAPPAPPTPFTPPPAAPPAPPPPAPAVAPVPQVPAQAFPQQGPQAFPQQGPPAPPGYGYGAPPGYPQYYPPPYYPQASPYAQPPGLLPPANLPYEDGQTVPYGYRVKARPTRSLILAGSLTFGITYLTSVLAGGIFIAGGSSDNKQYAPLFAPILGPFITIGTAGSGGGTPLLVLDGLAQLGGMVMLICGAAIDEKFLERSVALSPTLDTILHPTVVATPKSFALRWKI